MKQTTGLGQLSICFGKLRVLIIFILSLIIIIYYSDPWCGLNNKQTHAHTGNDLKSGTRNFTQHRSGTVSPNLPKIHPGLPAVVPSCRRRAWGGQRSEGKGRKSKDETWIKLRNNPSLPRVWTFVSEALQIDVWTDIPPLSQQLRFRRRVKCLDSKWT